MNFSKLLMPPYHKINVLFPPYFPAPLPSSDLLCKPFYLLSQSHSSVFWFHALPLFQELASSFILPFHIFKFLPPLILHISIYHFPVFLTLSWHCIGCLFSQASFILEIFHTRCLFPFSDHYHWIPQVFTASLGIMKFFGHTSFSYWLSLLRS